MDEIIETLDAITKIINEIKKKINQNLQEKYPFYTGIFLCKIMRRRFGDKYQFSSQPGIALIANCNRWTNRGITCYNKSVLNK